jgi:hypothetical protein
LIVAAFLALSAPTFAGESTGDAASPVAPAVPAPAAWIPGYDALRLALVADDGPAMVTAARALAAQLAGDAELSTATSTIADAADASARRTAFSRLSRLVILRLAADRSAPHVVVYHCPMFQGYGYWIQPKSGIANPYMGQAMPECGEEVGMKAAVKAAASG